MAPRLTESQARSMTQMLGSLPDPRRDSQGVPSQCVVRPATSVLTQGPLQFSAILQAMPCRDPLLPLVDTLGLTYTQNVDTRYILDTARCRSVQACFSPVTKTTSRTHGPGASPPVQMRKRTQLSYRAQRKLQSHGPCVMQERLQDDVDLRIMQTHWHRRSPSLRSFNQLPSVDDVSIS